VAIGYPVRVEGHLDEGLSRWLWLVKWLLAIPHYVVLAFLWIGFLVTSIIAFFAILFTGHYPRALFEYNVGVMRWSWRVSYYTYGALGTDRYPPFTLDDVPDYPARLDVAYPDHLSRGLVLVKWWLLAIPHYIIVGLFVGGASYVGWRSDDWDYRYSGGGLIGLLVLVAAVILAITGSYPRSLFDLVLGLNRWVLRVAAYAGLMTDRYPPFRLDMGGDEPGTLAFSGGGGAGPAGVAATARPAVAGSPAGTPGPGPAGPGQQPTQLTAGRVVALVVGAVMALVSLGLLAGGVATLVADRTQRDDAGFLRTDEQALSTSTLALVSEGIDLRLDGPDTLYGSVLGDVELRVTSEQGAPVFVGVADKAAAAAYLDGFRHDEINRIGGGEVTYRTEGTGSRASPPTDESFWSASTSGTGTQTLRWQPSSGEWVVVVMNADGSAGVDVQADVGADVPVLTWVWAGLLIAGGVLLLGAAVPIALAVRS
jgi:Domain of unknown function (DUF4389)